jgi:NAD(P)-dependent dehydrogenase (short-subunit alcohol dehydrogenase family)
MTKGVPVRRVVLITGASSGIGKATAQALSAPGTALVLAARARNPLEVVAEECRRDGAEALVVTMDVRDAPQVQAGFREALGEFGRIDAVVHSAAVLAYGRFDDVPAEVWNAAVASTVPGAANVAREALRAFSPRGTGRLVFVGSVLGKIAVPGMSSYVTAKWALHGLVRTLQIEARQTPDIRISLVSPGGVDTPIYRLAGTYLGRHGQPPPPVVSPERVASVVVRSLDRPRREVGVGLGNPVMVLGFRVFPALYDRLVTPLFQRIALARGHVPRTPGNVLEPRVPDEEKNVGAELVEDVQ